MARITVEDCLKKVDSRFELVILAARRAKMLMRGAKPLVESNNRPTTPRKRKNRTYLPLARHDRPLPLRSRPACDGREGNNWKSSFISWTLALYPHGSGPPSVREASS